MYICIFIYQLLTLKSYVMVQKNYTTFGEEWKKKATSLSKKELIDLVSKIGKENEELERAADHRNNCRDYLMGVYPKDLTVEDCLENLGYGRNGLRFE